jgi:hypothetical protein
MNNMKKTYEIPSQKFIDNDNNESIEETKLRFINKGIYENKIITTLLPSVVIWNKRKKCLVSGKDTLDICTDNNGNYILTYNNNVFISLQNRSELTKLDIDEINNSNGIIITNKTYGKQYYRYGFIPVS